jgi:ABC-type antimicrobial peptide transport system permease subunit
MIAFWYAASTNLPTVASSGEDRQQSGSATIVLTLVRLLMVESLVLAMAGAMLGIFLAWGGLKLLVAAMLQNLIPAESMIHLNVPVLAFTLCVAVLTALIFGLAPALQSSRPGLE